MTGDDQHFLDHLARVSSTVQNFFTKDLGNLAQHTDKAVGGALRQTVDQINSVLGTNIPLPGPYVIGFARIPPPEPVHLTLWGRTQDWMGRNRAVTAAIIAFLGTGAIGAMLMYGHSTARHRKRRAKKAKNGSRTEVVVIAGVPGSPIVKSLSVDLEKRGFIVHIVVTTDAAQFAVKGESRLDIKPLYLDLDNSLQTESDILHFSQQFLHPVRPFTGASSHQPHFVGLIIVPDTDGYPIGSIQHLPNEIWSDALSTHVLSSLTLARAFIPLAIDQNSRILVLTPNVVAPLRPALNGVESMVVGALEGVIGTLRRELGAFGVKVVHLKLGDVDFSLASASVSSGSPSRSNTRGLYGPLVSFPSKLGWASPSTSKGSHPKELHHAVFDALTMKSPCRTVRIGKGSWVYEMMGNYVPHSLTDKILKTNAAVASELLFGRQAEGWEKMEESVMAQ